MSDLALQLIRKEKEEKTGYLDIGNCDLRDLPEELFELTWLETLVVSNMWYDLEQRKIIESKNKGARNTLEISLPNDFKVFQQLQTLYLGGEFFNQWKINNIAILKELNQLQTLGLRSNKITDISFLKDLTKLNILDISDNKITDISFLKNLTKLNTLNIRSNKIMDISFLKELNQLQTLDIRSNKIQNYNFLKDLTKLNTLNIRSNKVKDISFLKNLTKLNTLHIHSNKITDISFLKDLTKLNTLDLRFNKITDISFLKELINLQSLDLRSNLITDISFLKELINLQSLNLRYNQITDISFLKKLINLQSLDLSNNKITDYSFLKKLINLQSLDLKDNKIKDITNLLPLIRQGIQVTMKPYKRGLNLYDNPIEIPPLEIVEQGNEAIINYFDQLEKENIHYLFEAKLIILGESGAGKTTLSRKIRRNNAALPKDEDTTKGIEVEPWCFDLSIADIKACVQQEVTTTTIQKIQKKRFRANLWDFGGQEIYHSTHQFFLSHRSLYVLLADTRKQDTDFNYWLNTVEQLGGNSPLLIVLNEKQGHPWRIDETGLRGRFDFLKDTYSLNLANKEDYSPLENLRRNFRHYLSNLAHIGDPLPMSWTVIREALAKEEQKFISLDRYFELCKTHTEQTPKELLFLSRYFHDIGVFLHYQDNPVLRNRIFLDANWTTQTVYKLLNDKEIQVKKGRFNATDVHRIWEAEEQFLLQADLLALLQEFNLAYRIHDTADYIAPEHLPDVRPYTHWKYQEHLLLFGYTFDQFMPKGLMARLIVALHDLIPNHDEVWLRGVVLQKGKAFAEITESYGSENRFDIKIAGQDKKELLVTILDAFDKILGRYPKLNFYKKVPCNCPRCRDISEVREKNFYDYEDLRNRLRKGVADIECAKNDYKRIVVRPMLEDVGARLIEKREDVRSVGFGEAAIVSRSRSSQVAKRPDPVVDETKPKNILVLAANPKDTKQLRLGEEVTRIRKSMERAKHRQQYIPMDRHAVQISDLRRAMLDILPCIVHFSGHGSSSGDLYLEDRNGNKAPVGKRGLSGLFNILRKRRPIDCVLLMACYAQEQAAAIAEYVPYVIGMNTAVRDDASIEFSEAFYDTLGADKEPDYELAFEVACNAIELFDLKDEHVPVLYKNGKMVGEE